MMEIEVRYGWDYAVNGDPCKYARLVLVDEGGREISSLDLGEITAAIKFIGVKVMDDTTELAAKLAAAERRERQLLDTTATCRMLRRELNTSKGKLAEVEAERDDLADGDAEATRLMLGAQKRMRAAQARADAAEAKLAAADAMIEAQQKDYASNNVRFAEAEHRVKVAKAALPAVYRLALADAGLTCEQLAEVELTVRNPPYVEGYSDAASICFENICSLPTPTAAELMARIQTGENE